MFSLKRVWDLTVYFEHFIFYFYCWIKMKVLLKHWLIKNENIFDVDALMTSTIITVTRPFFLLWYIHIYIYIYIYKWRNQRGRIDSLLLWVSRLSARQTELSSDEVLSDEFCLTSAFHKNQHLKYHAFQKPVNKTASKSIPESSIEIASFCSDFNARDILHFSLARERHRN